MNRPSGLATVGYGLTAVGFIQVAVTIAPHIAASIPAAGTAAPAVGVAVALAIDVVWAALMHTTIQTYRNGQLRPTLGFGGATALAVLASTILLASVGHMGPWSAVPVLAAILLILDGVREHVSVSPETAATIRERTATIRDARAVATIEAKHDAHTETINGYRESARLVARTAALAEIKTSVQRANWRASQKIATSTRRYATSDATPDDDAALEPIAPVAEPVAEPATTAVAPAATPVQAPPVALSLVASADDEIDAKIRDLVAQNAKPSQIAAALNIHRATVYRRIKAMGA